ncbi:HAD family hydrolase [Pseudomonas chlororaphis]|uniref:HAD family hydrolase n=1 Tax=Pseudomonas chlororaphis TaxID=587753 RepID=UPI000A868E75|nr:HAD hydrolase-like protein [Pseudomonas chlororaphis]
MLQERLGTPAGRTLFIGDTLHDYDVARTVGWKPLLVSTGHQDIDRLRQADAPVFGGLGELLGITPATSGAPSFARGLIMDSAHIVLLGLIAVSLLLRALVAFYYRGCPAGAAPADTGGRRSSTTARWIPGSRRCPLSGRGWT